MTNKKNAESCTITQLFEEQVLLSAEKVALKFGDKSLTYKALNDRVNQLAYCLKERNINNSKIIAVLMDRSLEMVVSLIAIMKTGCAYVPLEPDLPTLRLDYILKDADVSILIMNSAHRNKMTSFNGVLLEIDKYGEVLNQYSTKNPYFDSKPSDTAYVIYTSGSTGAPKGCILSHSAVCNRLLWMIEEFHFAENDCFLQKTPYGFDVSVWEFFCPLIAGAKLILAKPLGHKDPRYLVELIIQQKITISHFVPSMLQIFLNEPGISDCKSLRYVICSGEALTCELMQKFYKNLRDITLVNLYGPTEAAIDVSYWVCDKKFTKNPLPIGKPIANVSIFILDANLNPVALGEIGELYICGVCLADGYLNNDNLTKERFIANPFADRKFGERLYKTGDLGSYLCDGNILYHGRCDDQVKILGNRIELGEIETALCSNHCVQAAIVVTNKSDDDVNLVAFVQPMDNYEIIDTDLTKYLNETLPSYMIPTKYIVVKYFPVTSSGKIDKKKIMCDYQLDNGKNQLVDSMVTIDELRDLAQQIIGEQDIGLNDDLFVRGATSLSLIRLSQKIETTFSTRIPVEVYMQNPTLLGIYEFLTKKQDNISGVNPIYINADKESVKDPSITVDFFSTEERQRFREKKYNIRKICNGAGIGANEALYTQNQLIDRYLSNRSRREFLDVPININNFMKFISCLGQQDVNGHKKYQFQSAGGTYAVQTYVHVKANAVMQLEEGIYYFHPENNRLHLICSKPDIPSEIHFYYNRSIYERATFSLYFIAEMQAINPIYGETQSKSFVTIEVGSMMQLLMDSQESAGIGVCAMGTVNFDLIRDNFKLTSSHEFLQCVVGGPCEFDAINSINQVASIGVKSMHHDQDIAIIGISGVFPGANTLDEYWENLKTGKCSIQQVPEHRWNYELYHQPENSIYARWGGFIEDVDKFDPLIFNIAPAEAHSIDPQERLFLQQTWVAIENSGYTAESMNARAKHVGVFVGVMWDDYISVAKDLNPQGYTLTTARHAIANRVSHCFNFNGPSMVVDTSCSSGMTAIHLACESLKSGDCKVAIAGGVNLILHQDHYLHLNSMRMVSANNKCNAFSENGTGWVPGEGVGVVILKPLNQAIADKDNIQAVIKSSFINHSGHTHQFGMPNPDAQMDSLKQTLNRSNVSLDSIDYIECASNGALLFDSAEFSALQKSFYDRNRKLPRCKIGSVKPNIGHLESASALSQLTKVVLQLKYRQLVPNMEIDKVNSLIDLENSPFELQNELCAWEHDYPRRAAINSLGGSGSYGHLIIEEYNNHDETPLTLNEVIIVFSAASAEQLNQYSKTLNQYLAKIGSKINLVDLAYTLQTGRVPMEYRAAICTNDISDLKNKLDDFGLKDSNNVFLSHIRNRFDANNDLQSIAKKWVNGHNIVWTDLYHDCNPRKISLPNYPFEKTRYWLKIEQHKENSNKKSNYYFKHDTSNSDELFLFLKQIFAKIFEIPDHKLKTDTNFEEIGLTSLLIHRLISELVIYFPTLNKTVFFECHTIQELANYLKRYYPEIVETLLVNTSFSEELNSAQTSNDNVISDIGDVGDIAVIGMHGRFPGANNLQEFWNNLKDGKDCVTEIPKHRWDYQNFLDNNIYTRGMPFCKWGGFIEDADKFDANFFNIAPSDVEKMDPQERIVLESAWHAIEDAGYSTKDICNQSNVDGVNRIGAFVGVMWSEYPTFAIEQNQYAPFPHTTFWSIANRISYFFNFHGPSITLDTACSASLSALHMAYESIRNGESKYALISGVNLSLHPNKYLALAQMGFTSATGRCRSFGSGSDGYVPAEGVGTLLLKSAKKAQEDGDRIYGIIKATSLNHGGKTNGYTVPNPLAQAQLVKDALRKAHLHPTDISYIEAHGTGTPLGDPLEIQGLCKAFLTKTKEQQYCAIGSVKSNIGHAEAAAGVAGVIKVLLQMQHKMLVPTLHADKVNPEIDFENSPFYLQYKLTNWGHTDETYPINLKPLYAGVSSFGAGGSNAHVIIEESGPQSKTEKNKPCYLVTLSAKTEQAFRQKISDMITWLKSDEGSKASLQTISFTLNVGRDHFYHRMAWVVSSKDELLALLTQVFSESQYHKQIAGVTGKNTVTNTKIYEMAFNAVLNQLTNVINANEYRDCLKIIADCYVNGLVFDLSVLHDDEVRARISLPLYPFMKERFWISDDSFREHHKDISNHKETLARKKFWLLEEWEEKPSVNHSKISGCVILFDHISMPLAKELSFLIKDVSLIDSEKGFEFDKHMFNYLIDLTTIYKKDVNKFVINYLQLSIEHCRPLPLKILCVTKGLERYKNDRFTMLGAHKVGLYQMLGQEYGHVVSRHLDLDPYCTNFKTDAQIILAELCVEDNTTSVCMRNDIRFAKKIVLCESIQQYDKKFKFNFNHGEVLVITGGTRGIGMECAKHFAIKYNTKKIVLLGRKPLPSVGIDDEKNELSAQENEKLENIDLLKKMGVEVIVLTPRLDDTQDIANTIQNIVFKQGPIVGVIHAAGTIDTEIPGFIHKNIEKMSEVLSPKILGLQNLFQALDKSSLKFLILFSSISSLVPKLAVGLSDYAMANSYMDYFSQNTPNFPILSIRWPSWKEVGMGEVTSSTYLDTGLLSIMTQEGLDFIDQAVSSEMNKVLTPVVIDPERFSVDHLTFNSSETVVTDKNMFDPLENNDTNEETSSYKWLVAIFENELKMKPGTMDFNKSFQDYGADSIILSHIFRKIKQRIGGDLDTSMLYEYMTIAKLADFLQFTCPQKLKSINNTKTITDPVKLIKQATISLNNDSICDQSIAVVGMSCQFPGADDISSYWDLLLHGRSTINNVPENCWGIKNNYYAGLIKNVFHFDPEFFMIHYSDARIMDPQAMLLLKESLYALADAGYNSHNLSEEKVGVYIGARSQYQVPENILDTVKNPIMVIGQNYLAANISQFFNFMGPSIVFDTACSSSLVAMSAAIDAIKSGKINSALVGGVSLLLSPYIHKVFEKRNLLTSDKEFHIFDRRAAGITLGEGVGMVMLKPLKNAIQDNDKIYATVAGIAINNDGRTAGPATPNVNAQKSVMLDALKQIGYDPSNINYIEVNGSGSEVTDLLELKSTNSIYRSKIEEPCFLGSMKPNIGHLLAAEGIAGFIKVCLMLHKQKIVPFLSGQQPLKHFSLEDRNFILPRSAQSMHLPFAAINCFADGGTNAHVILKNHVMNETHKDKKLPAKSLLNLRDVRKLVIDGGD